MSTLEVAMQLTLKAMDGAKWRGILTNSTVEQFEEYNQRIAKGVGEMFTEIHTAVRDAFNSGR